MLGVQQSVHQPVHFHEDYRLRRQLAYSQNNEDKAVWRSTLLAWDKMEKTHVLDLQRRESSCGVTALAYL